VPGAFFLLVLVASLLPVACGGGDEGKGDLANGKAFDPAAADNILIGYEKVPGEPAKTRVKRCLQ
jgi:hypothetical protein